MNKNFSMFPYVILNSYQLVFCLLFDQEEKLPYAFYISDQELIVPLETYLEKNKGWSNLREQQYLSMKPNLFFVF